jgi:DNA-directed RNA polymerase subunit L
MPKSFHSQIDNMVNGGKLSEGIKEKLIDVAVDAKEKTGDALKDVAAKLEEVAKDLREKWDEKFEKKK